MLLPTHYLEMVERGVWKDGLKGSFQPLQYGILHQIIFVVELVFYIIGYLIALLASIH